MFCADILRNGLNPEDESKAENFNPKAQIFASASSDLPYLFTRNMHRTESFSHSGDEGNSALVVLFPISITEHSF